MNGAAERDEAPRPRRVANQGGRGPQGEQSDGGHRHKTQGTESRCERTRERRTAGRPNGFSRRAHRLHRTMMLTQAAAAGRKS